MILTGVDIQRLDIMHPCAPRTLAFGLTYGLGPAGYDVRIREANVLYPGNFMLGSTVEGFVMPHYVLGIVHDKSTLARQGIAVQNTVIEPGWRGHLTIELTNHGKVPVVITAGQPIAQIIFHFTSGNCEPYNGKYQDQPARPVAAIYDGGLPMGLEEIKS